ncbi:MAG TPA: substrate-binding domain-containing protein [Burkholderiales bacterium]|jgi:molybdate transport system substrate-binding protein|nr:substrate-binding domain-containing protein [Burkholderiales bacterium]
MKTKQIAGAVVAMVVFNAAGAAELKVLSAGALEPGMKAAVAEFQKASGHAVKITFNTAPQIRKRITDGEVHDVVVAPPAVIDEFAKAGKLGQDRANVGRVGMGVAVRRGAPVPDISSPEALKKSVLDAESLVFNRASSGIYLENLLKKMGVYDQVEKKTTRYDDAAAVTEHVLKGKGREIGFAPITEILLHRDRGLRLVGPLPAEVQNYTSYAAGVMTGAPSGSAAQDFVRYLGTPAAKATFTAAGIE